MVVLKLLLSVIQGLNHLSALPLSASLSGWIYYDSLFLYIFASPENIWGWLTNGFSHFFQLRETHVETGLENESRLCKLRLYDFFFFYPAKQSLASVWLARACLSLSQCVCCQGGVTQHPRPF